MDEGRTTFSNKVIKLIRLLLNIELPTTIRTSNLRSFRQHPTNHREAAGSSNLKEPVVMPWLCNMEIHSPRELGLSHYNREQTPKKNNSPTVAWKNITLNPKYSLGSIPSYAKPQIFTGRTTQVSTSLSPSCDSWFIHRSRRSARLSIASGSGQGMLFGLAMMLDYRVVHPSWLAYTLSL